MKIAVIGTGYVGLVTGVCLSDLGNDVVCIDIDKKKVDKLNAGEATIYELGLDRILKRNIEKKRLSFTNDFKKGLKNKKVIFLCVGTPALADGDVNLSYVLSAAKDISKNCNPKCLIVSKSTVPVGTAEKIKEIVIKGLKKRYKDNEINISVASNPEFLKEGSAILDFLEPHRIVFGCDTLWGQKLLEKIYYPFNCPKVITDVRSSELIKYCSNAFLATKISFINEVAMICEKIGADVNSVAEGMGLDKRIGESFLRAGIGYGGSCFPKDTKAFVKIARKNNVAAEIVSATVKINKKIRENFIKKVEDYFKGNLKGKIAAVLGLAFKPNTDDIRDAPSIDIIKYLIKKNVKVKAYDPIAIENTKQIFKTKIEYSIYPYEVIKDTDFMLVLTEWNEIKEIDLNKVKKIMRIPVIFDGRNIYNPELAKKCNIDYFCVGRNYRK